MLTLKDFYFKKTIVSSEEMGRYQSNDQFMHLAVELLKEVAVVTSVISCAYRLNDKNDPRDWTRNEAILGGLMVRISKLISSFLDQICQKRLETAMILFRCLGESIINVSYLLKNQSEGTFDEYIEYSLREEKRLLLKIEDNIKQRGKSLPIEERMKESIKRSFETSNFEIDKVQENNQEPWSESIYRRAKAINLEDAYFAIFALPSHNVHGNWQDLITNHLEYNNGAFQPNTDRKTPRPQPVFASGILSIEVDRQYIDTVLPNCPDKTQIQDLLNDIHDRIIQAEPEA